MGSPPSPHRALRLDHLVILVRDLDTAAENYRQLGFTVVPGGRHADGATHNALVVFADDTYLELVAFTSRWTLARLRLLRRLGLLDRFVPEEPSFGCRLRRRGAVSDGLVDYTLVPDDATRRIADARGRQLRIDGPFPGGRTRPDGQQVAWQLGFPHDQTLPFLCADTTPRQLRVPTGDVRTHANGALGIASLTIEVSDLHVASRRYGRLLGEDPVKEAEGQAVFSAGTSIVLRQRQGQGQGRPAPEPGPMQLTLEVAESGATGPLDRRLTERVEIDMVPSRSQP